jgi:hypothetical protein
MKVVPTNLGFSVADGERVELSFAEGDLLLRFLDWRENRVEHRFEEALAFRWSTRPTIEAPRDDQTYTVPESPWLLDEVHAEGYKPEEFTHYVLCFNAAKVLEVISRRPIRGLGGVSAPP